MSRSEYHELKSRIAQEARMGETGPWDGNLTVPEAQDLVEIANKHRTPNTKAALYLNTIAPHRILGLVVAGDFISTPSRIKLEPIDSKEI